VGFHDFPGDQSPDQCCTEVDQQVARMAVGDQHQYANGNTYIETDAGPIVLTQCFVCGGSASADLECKVSAVRCSGCLAGQYELLPGQRVYELKRDYAAAYLAASKRRRP
jgi:hypothetical protein